MIGIGIFSNYHGLDPFGVSTLAIGGNTHYLQLEGTVLVYYPVCKVAVFFTACWKKKLLLYTLGSTYFYSKNELFNNICIILDTI